MISEDFFAAAGAGAGANVGIVVRSLSAGDGFFDSGEVGAVAKPGSESLNEDVLESSDALILGDGRSDADLVALIRLACGAGTYTLSKDFERVGDGALSVIRGVGRIGGLPNRGATVVVTGGLAFAFPTLHSATSCARFNSRVKVFRRIVSQLYKLMLKEMLMFSNICCPSSRTKLLSKS